MKQPTKKQVQKIVDDFNRRVRVGDEVFYYPVLSKNRPPAQAKRLKTQSIAWILGDHTAVVHLEHVGTVAVSHCFLAKDNELFDKQQFLFKQLKVS
jgi:hypothetical protein